jgi:cellulose synthase/poly-beta-1,6-N-acetylglucosamine synthase-like glycosyltransferase
MDVLNAVLLVASLTVTLAFFVYGFNIYYMLRLRKKYKEPARMTGVRPSIAVHLPVFNERYVAERLLAACIRTAERYGKAKVRVLVLDDSTDETSEILEKAASDYRSKGFNVEVRHRQDRWGYKAGALNAALAETKEEFIVVFDSDFIPREDFLERAASYVTTSDEIGVVQFKWGYTNREYNWTTKAVSIGMDAHFLIEQPARYAGSLFLNFNGSAGIIRTKALRESGGWQADTLAEDLDASYRMQMNSYKIVYVHDDVPCEVPPTVSGFKRQQGRWARGSLQVAKKLLPKLLLDRSLTLKQKFEASVHLTYYLVHPLMYASFLLAAIAAILNVDSIKVVVPTAEQIMSIGGAGGEPLTWVQPLWVVFAASILLCTIAAWLYYVVAMRIQRISVSKNLKSLLALGFLGYGISASNTLEALKAFLLRDAGVFKRTPKYAVMNTGGSWRDKRYQVPIDSTSAVEAACIWLAVFAILRAIHFGNFGLMVILAVYLGAYVFVFTTTLWQSGKEYIPQ